MIAFCLNDELQIQGMYLIFWIWMYQGRNADALALYFGEDPARVPFEQGT